MVEAAELETKQGEVERAQGAVRTRLDFLERAMPSDSGGKPLLTGDGHRHAQAIEGRDGGTSQGFGYVLDATTALTLTRSGRIFTLSHQGVSSGDLHTEYARLLGRSGGQDLAGSTLTGETLTLRANVVDANGVLVLDGDSPHAALTGDLDVSGHGAFGAAASILSSAIISARETMSDTDIGATDLTAFLSLPTMTLSANRTQTDAALGGSFVIQPSGFVLSNGYGVGFVVDFDNNGTITEMFGSRVELSYTAGFLQTMSGTDHGCYLANVPTKTGAGAIAVTNLVGFRAENMGIAGVTNAIGMLIQAQSGATNNFHLVTEGVGGVVFNEDGSNADLRIEGDTDTDLFFVNAGTDHVGISTNDPLSVFDVLGSFGANLTALSSATTLDDTHHVVVCDASGGAFTVTLPAASGITRRIYHIKKTDSSANAVTVDGNAAETIDGGATATISTQFESIMIICDGSNWHIL